MIYDHIRNSGILDAIVNADHLKRARSLPRYQVFDADGRLIDEGDLLDMLCANCAEGDVIFDARTDRMLARQ